MIGQQTIGKRIHDGFDMFGVQSEEIRVVALLFEEVLPVITPIVDVVIGIVC